jgi:hypothetical protein
MNNYACAPVLDDLRRSLSSNYDCGKARTKCLNYD